MKNVQKELSETVARQNDANEAQRKAAEWKAAEEKEERQIRRKFRHDWAVAIVSALIGALISRPVWCGIDALIDLLYRLSGQ